MRLEDAPGNDFRLFKLAVDNLVELVRKASTRFGSVPCVQEPIGGGSGGILGDGARHRLEEAFVLSLASARSQ